MAFPLYRSCLTVLALLLVSSAFVLGHEGTRVWQIGVLALPAWMCLWWPGRRASVRAVQAVTVGLLLLAFTLDGAIRGFILEAYGAKPDSAMVLSAIANTTPQESLEFFSMYWPRLLAWKLLVLASLIVLIAALWTWWRDPPRAVPVTGWRTWAFGLLAALVLLSWLNKPWRKHHPLVFWPTWAYELNSLRHQWTDLGERRQAMLAQARKHPPAVTPDSPDTMVLVISDSINREHMSLYGYARDTTPQLRAQQRQEPSRLAVFQHAWSVDASTLPALRNFFHFGEADSARQHLLTLAATAGYRTWWISNHDDLAIHQEHALLADRVHMLNRMPGRSSRSLDESTLPLLQQALQDPSPRKLIVLHLLGAHPHYGLRYPPGRAAFKNVKDEVYEGMKAQGRSAWVRALRNEYDSALHFHDRVVAATLDLTRQASDKAVWLFFSDHAQEVGGMSDHVGHSMNSAAGYSIPLLLSGPATQALPSQLLARPVRSDWLGHTVMRLLGLDWSGLVPQRDVLDERYQWLAPPLPVRVHFAS